MVHAQGVGIKTVDPKSDFEVNGSFGIAVETITATTTLDANTKSMVICNNGATNITITLPAVATCSGRTYTIKKGTSSTGSIGIMGMSPTTIDGYASYMLTGRDESVTLFSNGTEWKTIGKSNEPFPMGEINYFNTTGTLIDIITPSNGSNNMVLCNPVTMLSPGMMGFTSNNAGRLTYTGDKPKYFHIACTISTSADANNASTFVYGLAKNGTVLPASKVIQNIAGTPASTALHVAIEMVKNDYLELYVGNTNGTVRDALIHSLTLFALGMD